jgi:tRNA uridine 5-carbamoylmethylation protein Kti12
MKVYITVGLPGSGKSTWSKKFAKENENVIIVNRDSFRSMIKDEYTFNFRYEPFIKELANVALGNALERGLDVIVDETHIKSARRKEIIEVVRNFESSYGLISTDYGKTQIICVWFTEMERNIENRMMDARGYDGMKANFEPPSMNEGYDQMQEINPFIGAK